MESLPCDVLNPSVQDILHSTSVDVLYRHIPVVLFSWFVEDAENDFKELSLELDN